MQNISTNWRKNMDSTIRGQAHARVRVSFDDSIIGAKKLWCTDVTDIAVFVATENFKIENKIFHSPVFYNGTDPASVATFEPNTMKLDRSRYIGSNEFDPHQYEVQPLQDTYVSNSMSGEDCIYALQPTVTAQLCNVENDTLNTSTSIGALTLDFGTEYPAIIRVESYKDQVLKSSEDVNVTNEMVVVKGPFEDINIFKIIFLKSLHPQRRARLRNILYGFDLQFNDDNIVSINVTDDADPISRRLPTENCQVKIMDFNGEYDPINPNGWWKIIRASLNSLCKLSIEWGLDYDDGTTEWISGGVFISSEMPKSEDKTLTFNGDKILNKLTEIENIDTVKATTFQDLLWGYVIYPRFAYAYKYEDFDWLSNYTVNLTVKDKCNKDYLQLIANGSGAFCKTDRKGTIQIFKLDISKKSGIVFDRNNSILSEPKVDIIPALNILNVKKYTYTNDNSSSVNIEYNYNKVFGENEQLNNIFITENTVANLYAKNFSDYLSYEKTYTFDTRGYPELDTGDIVSLYTDYGYVDAIVVKTTLNYNGAWSGKIVLKTK